MIESGLFQRLNAEVASVGGRIHPKKLPQNVQYPAVTYELVSDPRVIDNSGQTDLIDARYQVTSWGESYLVAKQVATAVDAALGGFVGTMGSAEVALIRNVGGRDLFDQDAGDSGIHHIPVDYMIEYRQGG